MADKAALFSGYWQLLTPPGAPTPTPEHRFMDGRKFRFDFAFIPQRIAVEIDGGQFSYRGGRHATDGDREKMNFAAAGGWRVFRFSPQMLEGDPLKCITQVLQAVQQNER